MGQCWEHKVEALSEWLEFLQIMEEVLEQITKYTDKMSPVPVNENNR